MDRQAMQRIVELEEQLSAYRFAVAFFVGQMTGLAMSVQNGSVGNRENIVKRIDEAVDLLHGEKERIFTNKEIAP